MGTTQRRATTQSTAARLIGLVLAGVGVAHLANPRLFTPLSRRAFPRRTRLYTYVNGAALTVVGLGIRMPPTRALATVVGIGYAAHLSGRAARTTRRVDRSHKCHAAALVDAEPLI